MSPFPDPFGFPLPVVVRIYLRIAGLWQLTDAQAAALAGASVQTLSDWRGGDLTTITADMHRRMGHLLGIYGALAILFGDTPQSDGWIKRSNSSTMFKGASALGYMLGDDAERIVEVHGYLYAEIWGNFGGKYQDRLGCCPYFRN